MSFQTSATAEQAAERRRFAGSHDPDDSRSCPASAGRQRSPAGWLDYRIYVGPVAGGIEYLVLELLPQVRRWDGVERWFFIRYVDDGGPHVRLRIKAAAPTSGLRAQADGAVSRALDELPSVPPPLYQPAIAVEPRAGLLRTRGVIRAVMSKYEPEIEKFGTRGVKVAEELFEHSSELAVRVLADEQADVCSRKTLVPCLMQSVTDAFVPSAGPRFWQGYATYWLRASRVRSADWRPRFEAKAQELRSRGVPIVSAKLPQPSAAALASWRRALAAAVRGYRDAGDEPPVHPGALTFNFVHLMNNRLGIGPLEEAYYATLMHEDAARRT